MPSVGMGTGKEVGLGGGAFHITNLTWETKGPSSTGLKRKTRWMTGESTGGKGGEGTWLGGAAAPSFLGTGRQPGHQVQAVTSQGQHSFCSLEITHLPQPSYSFCSLAGVGPLSSPEGVDSSAAWGPASSSVSPPLEAALASAPLAWGSWLSGTATAFPSWAVPSSLQAPISPCSCSSSVGEEADDSPPPSFRFLLKDRPLNLKGFLKENFFFFLGVSLGGTSPLASAPWLGGAGSMASPVAPAASSVPFTGGDSPSPLGDKSPLLFTWPFSCGAEETAVRVRTPPPTPVHL